MYKRRKFISKSLLATFTTILGSEIVFGAKMPENYLPLEVKDGDITDLFGKDSELLVLNDRPWNVDVPAHLLDDKITPAKKMFIRNNGLIPKDIDTSKWTLTFDGESVQSEKTYTLDELKSKFTQHTYQLTLECGGNGRSEYNPPAKGNQWKVGAVSSAEWTGVRLKDVLNDVGIKNDAVYIGYYGTDIHISGDASKVVISRGIPMAKAMQDEVLIAFQMNGKDIPIEHGYPLRMVVGGWPASTSGKWLKRLSVRNIIHDGPKMEEQSYRMPCNPVAPGTEVPDEDMCIIESMPVKSLITYPKSGATVQKGQQFEIRGHAWAGDMEVKEMHYSIDFGETWMKCKLDPPKNKLAWQHWNAKVSLPKQGYYEIWAKATDSQGKAQPMVVPGWNPRGYLNNACHRIAVKMI